MQSKQLNISIELGLSKCHQNKSQENHRRQSQLASQKVNRMPPKIKPRKMSAPDEKQNSNAALYYCAGAVIALLAGAIYFFW